jgi:hypothetical protein
MEIRPPTHRAGIIPNSSNIRILAKAHRHPVPTSENPFCVQRLVYVPEEMDHVHERFFADDGIGGG